MTDHQSARWTSRYNRRDGAVKRSTNWSFGGIDRRSCFGAARGALRTSGVEKCKLFVYFITHLKLSSIPASFKSRRTLACNTSDQFEDIAYTSNSDIDKRHTHDVVQQL